MEHAWAKNHSHKEEEGNSGIQSAIDDSKHLSLADGAEKGEHVAYKIEFSKLGQVGFSFTCAWKNAHLGGKGDESAQASSDCM